MPLTVVIWTLGFADAQRYWLIIANLFFNHHRTTSYCGSPWEMPYSLVYLCKAVSPLRECFSEHLLLSFLLFIEHLKCGVIVVQSHSLVSLWPPELKHVKLPHLSPSPGLCSNSCPLSWWCCLAISSFVVPFSFCLQSFPASGSFPVSWLFASGGQSIGTSASASVLPVNIQDWFPLGLTGLISLLFKGLRYHTISFM